MKDDSEIDDAPRVSQPVYQVVMQPVVDHYIPDKWRRESEA